MRRLLPGLLCCLLLAWGCDQPDEIYQELPDDYDPVFANGMGPVGIHFSGERGYEDPTLVYDPTLPTVEVCSDNELSERWAWMVYQPIIPMKGAAGLDMTGGEDWSGLTVDEAQSPDMLCQASYFADGIVAWGDYYEVIAIWDETTRQLYDILLTPGYEGTIEAGEFVFKVNEPITRDGVPLTRNDGSDRDPKTDENMREMDRALIRAFRPQLNADEIDCVETGSCYILVSGTTPYLVFMSVELYIPLEPTQQRIMNIEAGLKRPFRIGMGEAEVDGVTPTIYGTEAAGIPDCVVTFGTDWADIEADCLGGDPMAMAEIMSWAGEEQVQIAMGGALIYLERPGLAVDEILPLEPEPQAGDTVAMLSLNAGYEGDFSMPYSDILSVFKDNLDQAIRDDVPSLLPEDPIGVEMLRLPGDPHLPAEVAARYPDRVRPGAIYAVFCEDDGPDGDDLYDSCRTDSSGRPLMPLIRTVRGLVSSTLGTDVTMKLADPVFYTQHFERAVAEHFNGGPILDDQINYTPASSRPAIIYATILIFEGGYNYKVLMAYDSNDDRIHFMDFQRGVTRMEDVLFRDAELPTVSDPAPSGVFTMQHLLDSPRLGLGATGTVTVEEIHPETRRAMLEIQMGATETMEVLAPYLPGSSVTGYYIPIEGPHSLFQPSDYFYLYGNTVGAVFYMAPAESSLDEMEIVAITGRSFFGDMTFCGFPVRIGDYADELLEQIQDAGYPCEMIVRRSENREFITSIADMDSQLKLYVTNNMIDQIFVWAR